MSFKFWNKFFLITAFSFFILTATLNFIVNPYNLFHHDFFSNFLVIKNHTVSSRMQIFYKTIYKDPTNIMMGTSRIGMLSPSDVTKYLGGYTSNMSMPAANIEEQSQYLLYMINNYSVKNIVWSLDFSAFNPDLPNDIDFTYDRLKSTTFLNNDDKIALIGFQTTKNSFRTLYDNFKATKEERNNIKIALNDEDYEYKINLRGDILTKKKVDTFTKMQLEFYPKKFLLVRTFDQPFSIDRNLEKVQKVINLSKKKNINIVVYTSPVSKDFLQLYKDLNLENTFKYWKKSLAHITAYTDFCYYNDMTKNPYNFLDATHFRPTHSKLLFGRIFHDTSVKGPKDFGKYINKE